MTLVEVAGTIFFLGIGAIAFFCPSCFVELENTRDRFWSTELMDKNTAKERIRGYKRAGLGFLSIATFFIVAAVVRHITLTF